MTLHFETKGTGPPLLMCNGLGASIDTWGTFGDLLAEHHTLIMFDAPGCGESTASWLPYTMSQLASRVAAHVSMLGYTSVDVLGFSFGGTLSQQLAHQFPTMVNKLVLVSTLAGIPGLVGAPHILGLALNPWRFVSTTVQETVAPLIYGGDAGTLSGKRPSLLGVGMQIGAIGTWMGVTGIEASTLVLGGMNDPLTPVGNVGALVDRIPGARGVEVRGGGHLWVLNQPEVSSALVLDHLAGTYVEEVAA